jgi:hypothetical protein
MNLENLIKIYNKNTSKIAELNFYNESIKEKTLELLKKTDLNPYIPTKKEIWDKLIKYINKELKECEDYESAKAMYNIVLDALKDNISKSIKSIDKVYPEYGNKFSLIAYNICFEVDGKEYRLKFPILNNLKVEDVWNYNGYFTDACAKFSLFEHKTSVLWTEIWRGGNLEAFKTKED